MHPVLAGTLSAIVVLIVAELLRWMVRSLQSSVFSDAERKYIDERITHEINGFRIECDREGCNARLRRKPPRKVE